MDIEPEMESDEDAFEVDVAEPVERADQEGDAEPRRARRRVTRKVTCLIFFNRLEGESFECRCGCLNQSENARKILHGGNTSNLSKHMKACHPLLWTQFNSCKMQKENFNALSTNIAQLEASTTAIIQKNRKNTIQFPTKKVNDGQSAVLKSHLLFLMWQVANGLGRYAANCPLFDLYLRSLGSNIAPNRHTLQDSYLPLLNALVISQLAKEMEECLAISLTSDGWRSRTRLEFLSLSAAWCYDKADGTWGLKISVLDLIHAPASCSADTLEVLITFSAQELVLYSFP
jgi:hypothetical protein